jgi:hypothetical protein
MKHLCGYVILDNDHNLRGEGYDDINVDVHGGLTFASENTEEGREGWMIGFDCAHYGDLTPRDFELNYISEGQYRDMYYVTRECVSLAEQISVMPTKSINAF